MELCWRPLWTKVLAALVLSSSVFHSCPTTVRAQAPADAPALAPVVSATLLSPEASLSPAEGPAQVHGGPVNLASCSSLSCLITTSLYQKLFPNRNKFYTYASFVAAGKGFPTIGTTGSSTQRLREVAAFAAHVTQETAGLFYIREIDQSSNYCEDSNQYPCAPGQKYYGRGPLQISWNYNYGAARKSVGKDILKQPDLVAKDPLISFKAAFWFWTTPAGPIPSIHDVMVGKWTPSSADKKAGRTAGFGVTIDIINGNVECGMKSANANARVIYYKKFCKILGVSPGDNLSCATMKPWD